MFEVRHQSHLVGAEGFTTKLNAAVNDAFLPLRFILSPGPRHDVTEAPALITGYKCEYVIADAGYNSDFPIKACTIVSILCRIIPM
ncbi:transposase [Candidatus Poribacteria bacterium]|nr:transposase [Candidatus Poribacteria bacterium]